MDWHHCQLTSTFLDDFHTEVFASAFVHWRTVGEPFQANADLFTTTFLWAVTAVAFQCRHCNGLIKSLKMVCTLYQHSVHAKLQNRTDAFIYAKFCLYSTTCHQIVLPVRERLLNKTVKISNFILNFVFVITPKVTRSVLRPDSTRYKIKCI